MKNEITNTTIYEKIMKLFNRKMFRQEYILQHLYLKIWHF